MTAKRPGYLDGVIAEDRRKSGDAPFASEDDDLGYCVSRPVAQHGYHALAVKRNGKRDRVFEYAHLATSYEGDSERLDLVFAGQERWVVSVFGRRLLKLLHLIKERRVDWIREASGNAARFEPPDDDKPYIAKVDFRKVEEGEEE